MIYVASSWRNKVQQRVVRVLRSCGFEVYDFKHPIEGNSGFSWHEIDPDWEKWTFEDYTEALSHPLAEKGFTLDREAVEACTCCVLVLPCGRSAHLELGHIVGQGKPGFVYFPPGTMIEPELMYKWISCSDSIGVIAKAVRRAEPIL